MSRFLLFVLPLLLVLSGCSEDVLDFRNAEISNGKVFVQGEDEPFTGKVTDVPLLKLPIQEISMMLPVIDKVKGDEIPQLLRLFALEQLFLCDTQMKDGLLDGETVCHLKDSKQPLLTIPFRDGHINGTLVMFNPKPEKAGERVFEANYVEGRRDGKLTVHDIETGQEIYRQEWSIKDDSGVTTFFDATTGNQISQRNYVNGRIEGEVVTYAADGKTLISRKHYADGRQDGLEETYDQDGKLIKKSMWKFGVGQSDDLSDSGSAGNSSVDSNLESCVDRWKSTFRQEVGGDAQINADQITEWQQWCREGKVPD